MTLSSRDVQKNCSWNARLTLNGTSAARRTLKKNRLKPWLSEQWCLGTITGDYLWQMEDVLSQYALPDAPLRPLICFAERPCLRIGDVGAL
jgi:hypothetical protein